MPHRPLFPDFTQTVKPLRLLQLGSVPLSWLSLTLSLCVGTYVHDAGALDISCDRSRLEWASKVPSLVWTGLLALQPSWAGSASRIGAVSGIAAAGIPAAGADADAAEEQAVVPIDGEPFRALKMCCWHQTVHTTRKKAFRLLAQFANLFRLTTGIFSTKYYPPT